MSFSSFWLRVELTSPLATRDKPERVSWRDRTSLLSSSSVRGDRINERMTEEKGMG
ncbi:hypothetical protein [Pseudanabaena sp. FACHB-1998]|uniref:hypothetical protein n=1 Tax=Pseudanabaena sp. FACHB-1998 TaxID=2692858 RepID=UPI001F54E99A|nr:hypothetical protein [Pseudanabaena sp. FACHB-1998]